MSREELIELVMPELVSVSFPRSSQADDNHLAPF
jgi:hypothetical protein